MKHPNKIKIANVEYMIERPADISFRNRPDNEQIMGYQHQAAEVIALVEEMPSKASEAEFSLHEVFHALFDHFAIDTKKEELIVSTLARGVCMVLIDNPKYLAYLVEALKEKKSNAKQQPRERTRAGSRRDRKRKGRAHARNKATV